MAKTKKMVAKKAAPKKSSKKGKLNAGLQAYLDKKNSKSK